MSDAKWWWLKLSVGLVMTAGFGWLFVRGLDLATLDRAFTELSVPFLLSALTFLSAGYAVRIIRWWWMLRALEPNLLLGACVWPFLTSIAVNNVLPLRAGDALRVFGFRHQLRSPAMRVLGTLVVERVLDVAVLLGIFFVGLAELPKGVLPTGFVATMTWLALLCMTTVITLVLCAPRLGRICRRVAQHRLLARLNWSDPISRHGDHLTEALRLVRFPSRMLALIGLSVVAWAFEGAVFVTVAAAVHADITPFGPWFALATSTLATLLPSAPGYVGTFDYFATQGLAAYGATLEVAAVFALSVHALLWVPPTVAGALYLAARGIRLHDIRGRLSIQSEKEPN